MMLDPVAARLVSLPLQYERSEEFNEEFTLDPKKELQDLTHQIRMNQFLAILTTIAFAIIAVAALTVAALFAPIAIPFVLLGASALIPIFKQYVYDYFRGQEELYTQMAELQEKAVSKFEELEALGNSDLRRHLTQELHLNVQHICDQNSLIEKSLQQDEIYERKILPLIAKYETCLRDIDAKKRAFQEASSNMDAKFREKLQKVTTHAEQHELVQANAIKMAYEHRTNEMHILQLKVKAAWYLHLIHNPYFKPTFAESVYFYQLDPSTRLLNAGASTSPLPENLKNPYLGLADGTILSRRAVEGLSIDALSLAFSRGGSKTVEAWNNFVEGQRATAPRPLRRERAYSADDLLSLAGRHQRNVHFALSLQSSLTDNGSDILQEHPTDDL